MSEIAIRAEKIGKRYRVGVERYQTLRDALSDLAKTPVRLLRGNGAPSRRRYIWALRDVSFQVREGEVIGLIGRNGAGKTTLLKILARVTRPTEGWAELHGRVGSLLEVGTGFHPELTGRENVFLSGAILGMSRKEIRRRFDEIVAFSEVETFLDTPLKHYSSGMQTRLAFAVAAHLDPEILLVDEVLAVGDLAFQKKCLGKMSEVARGGRTVIFVSHQMNQIRRLCERVMWVDAGKIHESGPTANVVGSYEAAMTSGAWADGHRAEDAHVRVRFLKWQIVEPHGEQPNLLTSEGPVAVQFVLQVNQRIGNAHHGVHLYDADRRMVWGTGIDNLNLEPGVYEFTHRLPSLPLRPGVYTWRATIVDQWELVEDWDCIPELLISTEPKTHRQDEWAGVLNIPSEFAMEEIRKAK